MDLLDFVYICIIFIIILNIIFIIFWLFELFYSLFFNNKFKSNCCYCRKFKSCFKCKFNNLRR